MTFTVHHSQIRTLKPGDPNFRIVDGLVTAPRAGFEISPNCPAELQKLLMECWGNGWIKPIAYVSERELIFMGLTKND